MNQIASAAAKFAVTKIINDTISRYEAKKASHANLERIDFEPHEVSLDEAMPYFTSEVRDMVDILRGLNINEQKLVQALIESSFKEVKPISLTKDATTEFKNEIAFKLIPVEISIEENVKNMILSLPMAEITLLKKRFQTESFDSLRVSCFGVSLIVQPSVFLRKTADLINHIS